MADPIIAPSSAIVGPAIDAIVALRPEALAHLNTGGRWCDLPAMWRAQALLDLARLGDEAKSARLRFATGAALRTLAASEFGTSLPVDPQIAVGSVTFARPSPFPAVAPQGVIKKGTRFGKQADPNANPLPIAAASYESTRTVFVPEGQLFDVVVPIRALAPGADANVPTFTNYPASLAIQPGQALFDPTFAATGGGAAGGSSGVTDPVVVAAARAYASGQFGPTQGALIAALLQSQSVRHYAAFRAGALHYAQAYVADESWATGVDFISAVQQVVSSDLWQGFGCRSRVGGILNTHIAVAATIVLKSTDDLSNTDDIDDNVRAAAEDYFDTRPDFYRFRLASLQALLSRADPRILHCSQVAVTDAVTGATIPEPANTFGQVWNEGVLIHWYLTDRNVTTVYQPPT